jgi:hypothetical protein
VRRNGSKVSKQLHRAERASTDWECVTRHSNRGPSIGYSVAADIVRFRSRRAGVFARSGNDHSPSGRPSDRSHTSLFPERDLTLGPCWSEEEFAQLFAG